MKMIGALVFVLLVNSASLQSQDAKRINGYKVLCYVDAFAMQRQNARYRFFPHNINTSLCTHIVSTYATLDPVEYVIREANLDNVKQNLTNSDYSALSRLKRNEAGLKIIIAIGGWQDCREDEKSRQKYSLLVADASKRAKFIESVVNFLQSYNFDGLTFEWFDPTYVKYTSEMAADKENYVTLLRELKDKFNGKYELMASMPSSEYIRNGYHLRAISDIVDSLNIHSYNYVGFWTEPKVVGHHAALRQRPEAMTKAPNQAEDDPKLPVIGNRRSVSVDSTFKYLLEDQKLDAKKLILGIPFIGRGFNLADPQNHSPFDTFTDANLGPGKLASLVDGMRTYNEICSELTDANSNHIPTVVHDINYWASPYEFRDRYWMAYDDPRSVRVKIEYMKEKKLAGVLLYNIDMDDFHGDCFNGRKFPLLTAVYEQLMSNK